MKKNYLISWCDDNHDAFYWLNTVLLGCEIKDIVETVLHLENNDKEIIQIDIMPWDFPENIESSLFNYFQTIPDFDEADIKLIAKNDWQNFYAKNIKKIMRKVLTNKKP